MFLNKLTVSNFKNYKSRTFSFQGKVNAIAGDNGVGKTNLMDAIYFLCMTKSYFNVFDFQNIHHDHDFFRLEGEFIMENDRINVVCKVVKGKKKQFEVNDEAILKLSSHIGRLNVIFMAPDDNVLIMGGSEERRKFIDNTISQIDPEYLQDLLKYNKALKHRNALLKKFGSEGNFDQDLLHSYNAKLDQHGTPVHRKRKKLFEHFGNKLNDCYSMLSNKKEKVSVSYKSQLFEAPLRDLLLEHEDRDRYLQRTAFGIHKDDMVFEMDGYKVKRFSSQGQQKSYLLSLKLAQFSTIKNAKDEVPILLIDDIFDKLDLNRASNLLQMISRPPFGQVFISDTNKERLEKIFEGVNSEVRIFDI